VFNANDTSERMRIDSSGNVGIGTTAPDVNLVVEAATGDATLRVHAAENNSGSDPILILESSNDFAESTVEFKDSSGTGGAIRYNHGDNALRFQTNGTSERARIDSSGRLLVGTSTALASATSNATIQILGGTGVLPGLRIQGTDGNNAGCIQLGNDPTGAGITCGVRITGDSGGGTTYNTYRSSGGAPYHAFSVNSTEALRIDSNGHVTIYKDASNLARLQLQGSSTRLEYSDSSGDLTFYTNSSGRVQVGYLGGFRPVTDNSQSLGISGQRWTAVYAVNGTIQTSDLREKTDVATSSLGADFIKQLRPVSYKFKVGENVITKDGDGETDIVTPRPGERTHWGFVAQEVKEVVDAAGVDFGGWILTDKDDPDSTQGLRYDQFIAPLTKALQEAMERIETLEGMVAVNNITIDEQQHQLSTLAARLTALESA
jgi:hypothetical protein